LTALFEESRTQAKIRANFAERLREQFAGPLKPYITEKMRLFTRVRWWT